MRLRTWPILALAFATLIVLIALSGLSTLGRARRIFADTSALDKRYQESERVLNDIRNDIQISGLLIRDYLLDRSNLTGPRYRERLLTLRAAVPKQMDDMRAILGAGYSAELARLRVEIEGYWDTLDPVFEWTPAQKLAFSYFFLRREVLPKRDAVLTIANEIRDLNRGNLDRRRSEVFQKQQELPLYVSKLLTATLLVGLLVAGGSIFRITRLEKKSDEERQRAEMAEREMRRLSHQLVKAHEEERRRIARELHDEIGQTLTAHRMEIRNLRELRTASEPEFLAHVEETARLSEEALRAVRNLAMGLRPSMLDDLGLGPAVEWQAKEFSRRFGIPVTVQLEGPLGDLPDTYRTCVYRIVQEALTNCARHARASEIRISIHGGEERLSLTIQDDGAGFEVSNGRGRGLGLIGMEERVNEMGGRFTLAAQPGKGTVLSAEIPLLKEALAI